MKRMVRSTNRSASAAGGLRSASVAGGLRSASVAGGLSLALCAAAFGCGEAPTVAGGHALTVELPAVMDHSQPGEKTRVVVEDTPRLDPRPIAVAQLQPSPIVVGAQALPEPIVAEEVVEAPVEEAEASAFLPPGALCTASAGEWGADCDGSSNAACMLRQNYSVLFTGPIELGYGDKHFSVSGPDAIRDALPGLAAAKALDEDYVDPSATDANRLATELVALSLNVAFHRAGKMGAVDVMDTEMLFGRYTGWRVDELAEAAHAVLSGETVMEGPRYDPANLSTALARVNAAGHQCRAQRLLGLTR